MSRWIGLALLLAIAPQPAEAAGVYSLMVKAVTCGGGKKAATKGAAKGATRGAARGAAREISQEGAELAARQALTLSAKAAADDAGRRLVRGLPIEAGRGAVYAAPNGRRVLLHGPAGEIAGEEAGWAGLAAARTADAPALDVYLAADLLRRPPPIAVGDRLFALSASGRPYPMTRGDNGEWIVDLGNGTQEAAQFALDHAVYEPHGPAVVEAEPAPELDVGLLPVVLLTGVTAVGLGIMGVRELRRGRLAEE